MALLPLLLRLTSLLVLLMAVPQTLEWWLEVGVEMVVLPSWPLVEAGVQENEQLEIVWKRVDDEELGG
jgi:hypothetical protein